MRWLLIKDLQILKRFAQLVELAKLGRRLSAQDVVADFSDNLAEELDFRLEAQSMEAWVSGLHGSPLGRNITVPRVHWEYTSERVLTMERVHGVRIDDVCKAEEAPRDCSPAGINRAIAEAAPQAELHRHPVRRPWLWRH